MPELRRSTRIASTAAAPAAAAPPAKKQKTAPEPSAAAPAAEAAPALEIGDPIPDWFLLDQDEKEVHLAKLERPIVVIFLYPKASTPGCTRQACGFRDNYNALTSKAVILGLLADLPLAQKSFAKKHGFQYSLLSDPGKKLLRALGGLKADGKIARSHWIFVDGVLRVKKIGISPEVSFNSAKEDVEELAGTEPEPAKQPEPEEQLEPEEKTEQPEPKEQPEELKPKEQPETEEPEPKESLEKA